MSSDYLNTRKQNDYKVTSKFYTLKFHYQLQTIIFLFNICSMMHLLWNAFPPLYSFLFDWQT